MATRTFAAGLSARVAITGSYVGNLWKTVMAACGFTMPRVLVYAGIDEAGYGPLLGPLCVACTAFTVREHQASDPVDPLCDLWKRLNQAVCRKRTDKRRRIAVDDSKLLKGASDGPHHPLKFLERAVLSFLAQQDGAPSFSACHDLLAHLGVAVQPHEWYAGKPSPIPVGQTIDEIRIAAARLRKALDGQGVACDLIRCEAIDGLEFNEQVERMGNKANVNLCAALRLIDLVWNRWSNHHPFIAIDHLGGRVHYLQTLMQAYPDAHAQVLDESESVSSYRLTRRVNGADSTLSLTFRVGAESKHLPVALASMTAKYVRELFMLRMNRHFCGLVPELKPTAGYNEDGRRYLADIEPVIAGRNIDRRLLVRCV